ncbi:hypothetical protein RD792_000055 [Penstemon davidsonii]|uniref:Ferric reductase NAD binding domain-containing protein n=1 Tax=Penstemon davidsonii TaxID=160366 RepID=A0ABR0DU19_9LAMI|nr:hypothetical protein RD792_000055 [Penstemon davidsonii]
MITATIAFTLNKKRNTKETRQIQSVESWPNEVDRELESFNQQSFAEFTTLHYGQRPDLKKILFDCEESNVGVFVSGPEKMRQDVATICSSDLAKKLQYESFSFNW